MRLQLGRMKKSTKHPNVDEVYNGIYCSYHWDCIVFISYRLCNVIFSLFGVECPTLYSVLAVEIVHTNSPDSISSDVKKAILLQINSEGEYFFVSYRSARSFYLALYDNHHPIVLVLI